MHLLFPVPVTLHFYEETGSFQVGSGLNSLSIHNLWTRKVKIRLTGVTNWQQQPAYRPKGNVIDWCLNVVRLETGIIYDGTQITLRYQSK
jgi:hypothetical protein